MTYPPDDSAHANFKAQRFSLLLLLCCCMSEAIFFYFKIIKIVKSTDSLGACSVKKDGTCDNVGVKHGSVLQGAGVPAAHSVAFLGEVCLVTFLQDGLGVPGWTL